MAERKVEALLSCGAQVTVISPAITARLGSWARGKKIRHLGRPYRAGDLAGYDLAFVATDKKRVNEAVFHEARSRGVWVNCADEPDRCDFILPSIVRRGGLVVAIGTGGSSPALSRAIREELEGYFTADYTLLAEIAAEVRRKLKERSIAPGPEAWRRAVDPKLRQLVREGRREEAKDHLLQQLGVER